MKLFIPLLILACFCQAQAAMRGTEATECDQRLKGRQLHSLINKIARSELNKPVAYRVRLDVPRDNHFEFATLQQKLRDSGFHSHLKLISTQDTGTVREYHIEVAGEGREVAKTLLEMTKASLSGVLAAHLAWMTERPAPIALEESIVSQTELVALARIPTLELGLSLRTWNFLANDNIYFIGDLLHFSRARLLRIPMVGRKVLTEIEGALSERGLALETVVPGWPPEDIDEIEIKFAKFRMPDIQLDDWVNRDADRNLNLLAQDARGLTMQRPAALFRSQMRPLFVAVNYEFFKSTKAEPLYTSFNEAGAYQLESPVEKSQREEWQKDFLLALKKWTSQIELATVSFWAVANDKDKLLSIARGDRPVLVVNDKEGDGAVVLIPLRRLFGNSSF